MSERPIAYVMEQTLGNITHYVNLRSVDAAGRYGGQRWIPIEFRETKLPWTVPASFMTWQALRPILDEIDGVFIHTMTLAAGAVDIAGKKPVVISTDGPALAKRNMRAAYGLKRERPIAERLKGELYRLMFKRAAGFVAWSNWAKQSLVEDYGCRDEDVAVISPGIDVERFAPGDRDHPLPRVLFVGGDFSRKGGDLLLEAFRSRLRGRAELVLVTRDDVAEEPGVSVHRNLQVNSDELRNLYATCDVFVLPTRADCHSLVCMEALAAGMPVVSTRIGGIPDLVLEGTTGHLVDVDDMEALADRVASLVDDAGKRREMGAAARKDALERFCSRANALRLFEFVRSRC